MKRATEHLLCYVKKANTNAFPIIVKPLHFADAKPNHCFENAMKFLDQNESWVLRSGWIIGDDFGEHGTPVLPHYWVFNPANKNDYDVTPLGNDQTFEYVLDLEIARHMDMKRKLSAPVPLKIDPNGVLSARTGVNCFIELSEIDYAALYDLVG